MKRYTHPFLLILFLLTLVGTTACTDEWDRLQEQNPLIVEEGLEGTLSLTIGSYDFENRVTALTRADTPDAEDDEQHLHSIYIFVIDMKNENSGIDQCPIIARKYISDVTGSLTSVNEEDKTWNVLNISMKALSCQTAEIFAVANLGYSEMQHIENDADLLALCDEAKNLSDLQTLSAELSIENGFVNVERMQGHHLMSGFYADFSDENNINYLKTGKMRITLEEEDGNLNIYDSGDKTRKFRALGAGGTGVPGAVILHRLDSKVTFNIKPTGALATTPGAYFRLTSWQVKNASVKENVHWYNSGERHSHETGNSKVFQRDISETDDAGWTFSFYQFENCAVESDNTTDGYLPVTEQVIADQYNMEYGRNDATAEMVKTAFSEYPNGYSQFAYTLRELQKKEDYEPGISDDQTVTVTNGDFEYAPQTATYVELKGEYYNPDEPVRRSKTDARNNQYPLEQYPLDKYPYWSVENEPATLENAAKRTRTANVTYKIHLGYVGGGNQKRTTDAIPASVSSIDDFLSKVNDYNILRNHHYTYEIQISGVNNIKVEATREDGGNIYEQEKQTGAEGTVVESQHFFRLDAHYETRNLTFDFQRMPQDATGYGFELSTPYQQFRAMLKQKSDGTYGLFREDTGTEISGIRGLDLDWIHFAWHGTEDDPHRSLINPDTGNGISYSKTYGGYTDQQTYNAHNTVLTHDRDADHSYYLMNCDEFVRHVWEYYQKWIAAGKPTDNGQNTMTYTIFVDEFYYDNNPTDGANVDWMSFCNQSPRTALFFMEGQKISADKNSVYTDAHIVITQQSIQTPYATSTAGGQNIADVAFGIEHLDEFQAKYSRGTKGEHYFDESNVNSRVNGLYNAVLWYNNSTVIGWQEAEGYFNDKAREYTTADTDYAPSPSDGEERSNRRGGWAIYSRNRDLNRDGILDLDEIRWFVPALDQYLVCFLGGRPAFENPIFESSRAIRTQQVEQVFRGTPLQQYLTSTKDGQRVYWAEEGCSMSGYNEYTNAKGCYGIRMARMLRRSGLNDHGSAFGTGQPDASVLEQDPVFIVTRNRNGQAISNKSPELVDGENYYITLDKLNTDAFRDYVASGELAQHDHEQKNNWLYREYKIAKNKIGYTSWTDKDNYDRTWKVNGISRTWWQLNGVWTDSEHGYDQINEYYYKDATTSIAYNYTENSNGDDLHQWRIPNLREAAIMNMAFDGDWFKGSYCTRTRSANLGPNYYSGTRIPYFSVKADQIVRIGQESDAKQYVRPVHDVR